MRPLLLIATASLVAAAACGGSSGGAAVEGGSSASTVGPADAQTFTMRGKDNDTFDPQTLTAKVGKLTLTLQNGGVPHNLTFKDGSLPGISTVSGSETKSTTLTFDKAGTFVFECTIHPGMEGKVVVEG